VPYLNLSVGWCSSPFFDTTMLIVLTIILLPFYQRNLFLSPTVMFVISILLAVSPLFYIFFLPFVSYYVVLPSCNSIALNSLLCVDVPLGNPAHALTHSSPFPGPYTGRCLDHWRLQCMASVVLEVWIGYPVSSQVSPLVGRLGIKPMIFWSHVQHPTRCVTVPPFTYTAG